MEFAISEDLWFADDTDEAASRAAADCFALAIGKLVGVRAFPEPAQRLMRLTRDPNFKLQEVVKTLEADPALTSRVLRLANSSSFSLRRTCTSITQATTLLGARTVSELAMVVMMLDTFGDARPSVLALRDHAAAVASIARFLAMQLGRSSDDVYAAALLHDVGKLLLLQHDDATSGPTGYARILEATAGQRDASHLLEREVYGFDHAVLAGHLLRAWGLPEPLPTVVGLHHQPSRAYGMPGVGRLVSLVRLSDRLAYELPLDAADAVAPDEEDIALAASDPAAEALGLDAAKLTHLWSDLQVAFVEGHKLFSN